MYLEYVISWNDMVLMVEQRFMTQMSNWMTDRPWMCISKQFTKQYFPCFILKKIILMWLARVKMSFWF